MSDLDVMGGNQILYNWRQRMDALLEEVTEELSKVNAIGMSFHAQIPCLNMLFSIFVKLSTCDGSGLKFRYII